MVLPTLTITGSQHAMVLEYSDAMYEKVPSDTCMMLYAKLRNISVLICFTICILASNSNFYKVLMYINMINNKHVRAHTNS